MHLCHACSLFYGFGTFLHWGFESTILDAHNPVINTAYQHYYHHANSYVKKAMYTGFFFRVSQFYQLSLRVDSPVFIIFMLMKVVLLSTVPVSISDSWAQYIPKPIDLSLFTDMG